MAQALQRQLKQVKIEQQIREEEPNLRSQEHFFQHVQVTERQQQRAVEGSKHLAVVQKQQLTKRQVHSAQITVL